MKSNFSFASACFLLLNPALAQEQNVTQRIDRGIKEIKNFTAIIESTKDETKTQIRRLDELNHQAKCAAKFNAIADHFIKFMFQEVNGNGTNSLKNIQALYSNQQNLYFADLKQQLELAVKITNGSQNLETNLAKIQEIFRPNSPYEIKIRQNEELLHTKLSWISASSNGYLPGINSSQLASCADLQEKTSLLLDRIKQVSDRAREQVLRLGKLSLLRQLLREDLGNTLALRATKHASAKAEKSIG